SIGRVRVRILGSKCCCCSRGRGGSEALSDCYLGSMCNIVQPHATYYDQERQSDQKYISAPERLGNLFAGQLASRNCSGGCNCTSKNWCCPGIGVAFNNELLT